MSQPQTVKVRFGADVNVKMASASERAQGSVAFLRSATLTINGKPPTGATASKGFRLNAAQAAVIARMPDGKAGEVTLPLGQRGRPRKASGLSALATAIKATATPRTTRPRKPRTAPQATSTAPAAE